MPTLADEPNYHAVMRANAERVFSEPDPGKRLAAMAELWAPDGTLFEQQEAVSGHEAISESVGALLRQLPPETVFTPAWPAMGHHGLGLLRWAAGRRGGAPGPFKPKMVGGAMIGPQNTEVKAALGPSLNGFVNYEYWPPIPALLQPAAREMLDAYQALAAGPSVDPLGHYMAPMAYAQLQVLEQAVTATRGVDDAALIAYSHRATFDTVLGPITFAADGEWVASRVLQVQFRGIADSSIEPFRNGSRQVVVAPDQLAFGELIYPYV